ncbi:IS110 family transposase [Dactylosporangium sp. AC04546]|uniref:IS110 family transposase n=1 Tax=Dactylosporangium sp. AC04546 TaxID=2862460 RepID=UPI001EDEF089|nr:IS110 family transposase [Dactylosporangium sp. AC04546]WVK84105.1 IS110 family transposase [Dactylosporangium sp. AC04546]
MSLSQQRFAGIDWASDNHAVCVVDEAGEPVERLVVAHSKAGISKAVGVLRRHGVAGVGIERPDGPLVAGLVGAGLDVFVVPPSQVKSLRRRFGSAGHKDDRFDAYVLADTVRTDRRRLVPLRPDAPATTALRTLVRARADLVGHRVAMVNQLRAHLDTVLPAAAGLFHELTSPISRAFLTAFPTQNAVDALTLDELAAWLAGQRYRAHPATVIFDRLQAAPAGVTGPAGTALAAVTQAYLTAVTSLIEQTNALEEQIAAALAQHPDGHIFTSLPRAGTVRAARLLAEIGDARGRYPTAAALAGLAGVTPSTRQSGQVRVVAFRWAVNKQLRGAVCDFAADTIRANPWAANLYHQARNRGHRHPHAVRILARAWLSVIWKLWTTHTPYQPERHNALQKILTQTP